MEIIPLRLGFVNAYAIKSKDDLMLIDTGLPFLWSRLEKEISVLGKPKLVVLTHGDPDHSGNCRRLQEKFGAKIAMHEADLPVIRRGSSGRRTVKPFLERILFSIFGMFAEREWKYSFTPDILLKDGQSLKEYGFDARVVHVPGHTRGSIAVLTREGDLFSGDTIVNRRKPEPAVIIEDEKELDESMKRLRGLDVKTVYPGHGKPFGMKEMGR